MDGFDYEWDAVADDLPGLHAAFGAPDDHNLEAFPCPQEKHYHWKCELMNPDFEESLTAMGTADTLNLAKAAAQCAYEKLLPVWNVLKGGALN